MPTGYGSGMLWGEFNQGSYSNGIANKLPAHNGMINILFGGLLCLCQSSLGVGIGKII